MFFFNSFIMLIFNVVTNTRDALVADEPGLTRDRKYGYASFAWRRFIVIDTGGLEPDTPGDIYVQMARQTEQAIVEADAVIFVVDARSSAGALGLMQLMPSTGRLTGRKINMPIQETFWAHRFGMLVDRYGTPWMVNCEKPMN